MRHSKLLPLLALSALSLPLASQPAHEGDRVKWRGIAEGERESRSTGKPAFYFFTADWCGPCRMMKSSIFSDEKWAAHVEKEFVPIVVLDRRREDGSNPPEVDERQGRFAINGFPTLVVTTPDGKKALNASGWAGRDNTLRFLTDAPGLIRKAAQAA
jgi:thioredoxin 1